MTTHALVSKRRGGTRRIAVAKSAAPDDHEPQAEAQAEQQRRDAWWSEMGFVTSNAAAEAENVIEATVEKRHNRGKSVWVRCGRQLVTSKEAYRQELLDALEQRREELQAARAAKGTLARKRPALL